MTARRWHSFRIVYALGAVAVLLDSATTALGRMLDPHYEKNPLGASLLSHGGFLGTTGILVALGVLLYGCGRMLARRRASGRLAVVNGVLAAVVVVRVTVVVAAALSIAGAVQ